MTSRAAIWIGAAGVVLAAAWQCSLPAGASQRPPATEVNQAIVHFGDLNVDRPEGAALLYRRIRHAAESVCGEQRDPGTQMISVHWRSCVARAIDDAVVSLDRPALTAYHRVQRPLVAASQ
jgi:UrcA family protein